MSSTCIPKNISAALAAAELPLCLMVTASFRLIKLEASPAELPLHAAAKS